MKLKQHWQTNLVFNQFCEGNSSYNYSGFCQKVLKKRDLEIGYKRCKRSYEDFFSILKDCYYEIYNYFNSSDLLKNYKFSDFYDFSLVEFENIKNFNQDKIDDFNTFVIYLKENFAQFSNDLNVWKNS